MKNLHLQVEDGFYEELLSMLPEDKVKIITEQFLKEQSELHAELEHYFSDPSDFTPYYDNMGKIDQWLSQEGSNENS